MIWPFTTIATLRRELGDATARVNALYREIEDATERQKRSADRLLDTQMVLDIMTKNRNGWQADAAEAYAEIKVLKKEVRLLKKLTKSAQPAKTKKAKNV
jgi:chromosome segregation ATPase